MAMAEHIHCIGIGGIGVSALARLYRSRGIRVTGCDLAPSEITDALRKEGIRISIGHSARHISPSVAQVVRTSAVPNGNSDVAAARRRGIPVRIEAQVIGEISRDYTTVAVTGAHGKSTTTALAALALARAGRDPTVIVGAKLREFGNSNFRAGGSRYFVIEADDYRAKFLHYRPAVAVITNIDREHLDFYKNIQAIEAAFLKFLLRLKYGGNAVLNRDDPRLRRIATRLRRARPDLGIHWYSLKDPAALKIRNVISIPGEHNVSNALAARAAGRALGIPEGKIIAAIRAYRGAWRRFDYQGKLFGAKVFADYAHHPTEIKATLQAAREKFRNSRIWCVFQPHHYERTRDLFREFSRAFYDCDGLILLDIYEVAGRERPVRPLRQSFSEASRRGGKQRSGTVSSERLARAVSRNSTPALYLPNPARLRPFLANWLQPGDILLMMGAGSIWEMTKALMRPKGKGRKTKALG